MLVGAPGLESSLRISSSIIPMIPWLGHIVVSRQLSSLSGSPQPQVSSLVHSTIFFPLVFCNRTSLGLLFSMNFWWMPGWHRFLALETQVSFLKFLTFLPSSLHCLPDLQRSILDMAVWSLNSSAFFHWMNCSLQ